MKLLFSIFLALPLALGACSTNKMKKDAAPTANNEEDNEPSLTKPKIKSFIVPDTIEGNKYIKSHRVFILEDAGSWSKD